jgi:type IV secretion system protein VirB11
MTDITPSLGKDSSGERLIVMLNTALGPQVSALLLNENVIELMLNQDGKLWADRLGQGREFTGLTISPEDAERIIKLVASGCGAQCNGENPILSAEFPGSGNRFQGLLAPVVSAPVFSIRKKALMIFSLEDYILQEILSVSQKELIEASIRDKRNILIVGGTGTGKTTFANAILNEIAKTGERVVIIEDTLELQCSAPDTVFLRARDKVATMNDLLKATMRLRPDRIVVGEVRGGEALSLLKAWNTGHPGGCATVHANSAKGALTRLEQLVQEAVVTVSRELIAEAVDLVIHIDRFGTGRRIREIIQVDGVENGKYRTTRID